MACYVIRDLPREDIQGFRQACFENNLKPQDVLRALFREARPAYDILSDQACIRLDLTLERDVK